jgi:hypothetical protein
MPKAWSSKDERQYEHIKESAGKRGRSSKRAKQIAAATVNKKRSAEGRTKKKGRKKTGKKRGKKTSRRTGGGRKRSTSRRSSGGRKRRTSRR